MNSQYLGPGLLLAIAAGIAVGFSPTGDQYCPSPSAASTTALFAPCQTFDSTVGRSVTKSEAVQIGLLMLDLQAEPASQLADNLRSAPLPPREPQTVGLVKSRPK
jgi:hypothetical protein